MSADIYTNNGFDFRITTSSPSLVYSLKKNNWILKDFGRGGRHTDKAFNRTNSMKRNIFTFKFKK